jgi:ornithine--oxo-acid transaminase
MLTIQPGEHGSTYGGNPLACAVAMRSLQVLVSENMIENAERQGQLLRQLLTELSSPFIKEVRGRGLLNAIVIQHPNPEAAWELCLRMMKKGLLAKPTHGDKIRFAPPLIITSEQIREAVQVIAAALEELS